MRDKSSTRVFLSIERKWVSRTGIIPWSLHVKDSLWQLLMTNCLIRRVSWWPAVRKIVKHPHLYCPLFPIAIIKLTITNGLRNAKFDLHYLLFVNKRYIIPKGQSKRAIRRNRQQDKKKIQKGKTQCFVWKLCYHLQYICFSYLVLNNKHSINSI